MLSSRIEPCTCQGGLSLTITHFLYWLESPHCFQNRKSPCIPTNNKFPLGGSHNFKHSKSGRGGAERSQNRCSRIGKKKNERKESWPPKSVEISIRQVWIGQLSWCEMLQDTCSFSLQFWAHVVGYITSAWGNAIIRVSCLMSTVIALFKLLRRCLWSHLLSSGSYGTMAWKELFEVCRVGQHFSFLQFNLPLAENVAFVMVIISEDMVKMSVCRIKSDCLIHFKNCFRIRRYIFLLSVLTKQKKSVCVSPSVWVLFTNF